MTEKMKSVEKEIMKILFGDNGLSVKQVCVILADVRSKIEIFAYSEPASRYRGYKLDIHGDVKKPTDP